MPLIAKNIVIRGQEQKPVEQKKPEPKVVVQKTDEGLKEVVKTKMSQYMMDMKLLDNE